MTSIAFSLIIIFPLTLLCIASCQERAPHGLAYENPTAFSPSAYDFFHPNTKQPQSIDPCSGSKCSPLPLAAQVEATQAYQSSTFTSQKGRNQLGAGGIAGIVLGLAFAVFMAMGVYYVLVTRRTNIVRAHSIQPDP